MIVATIFAPDIETIERLNYLQTDIFGYRCRISNCQHASYRKG